MYQDTYIPNHQPAIGLFKYMYKDVYQTITKRAFHKWKRITHVFHLETTFPMPDGSVDLSRIVYQNAIQFRS